MKAATLNPKGRAIQPHNLLHFLLLRIAYPHQDAPVALLPWRSSLYPLMSASITPSSKRNVCGRDRAEPAEDPPSIQLPAFVESRPACSTRRNLAQQTFPVPCPPLMPFGWCEQQCFRCGDSYSTASLSSTAVCQGLRLNAKPH